MAIVEILENGYPMPRMPMGMYPMGAVPGIGDQVDDHFKRHWLKYLIAAGLIGGRGIKKYNAYDAMQQQTNQLMNVKSQLGQYKNIINDPKASAQDKANAAKYYDSLSKQYGGEPGLELQISQAAQKQADAGNIYKNSFLGRFWGRGVETDPNSILGQNQDPGANWLSGYQQQQADAQAAQEAEKAKQEQLVQRQALDAERAKLGLPPKFYEDSMTDDMQSNLLSNMGKMNYDQANWFLNTKYKDQKEYQDAFMNQMKANGNQDVYKQLLDAQAKAQAAQQQPANPDNTLGNNPQPQQNPTQSTPQSTPTQITPTNPAQPNPLVQDLKALADAQNQKLTNNPIPQSPVLTQDQLHTIKNTPGISGENNPNVISRRAQRLGPEYTNRVAAAGESNTLDINTKMLLVMQEAENPDYDNYQTNQSDTHQDNGQEDANDNKIPEDNKSDNKPTFFQRHKNKFLGAGVALLGAGAGATGIHISKNNHFNKAIEYAANANTIDPKDNHRSILKANLMTKAVDHGIKGKILNKYDIVQKVKDSFSDKSD